MKIVKNGKTIKAFRPKFSIQKNIAFSNTNKIVNKLARALKILSHLNFNNLMSLVRAINDEFLFLIYE